MLELAPHPEGVLLPVKARAGARGNSLRGVRQGKLLVGVTQAPEKGKANDAIVNLLCAALGLKRSQVALAAGPASADKKILIRGVTPTELAQRIDAALAQP